MIFKADRASDVANESAQNHTRTAALPRQFWLNFTTFPCPIASDSRCQPLPLAKGIDSCYTCFGGIACLENDYETDFAPFLLLANFAGPVCAGRCRHHSTEGRQRHPRPGKRFQRSAVQGIDRFGGAGPP